MLNSNFSVKLVRSIKTGAVYLGGGGLSDVDSCAINRSQNTDNHLLAVQRKALSVVVPIILGHLLDNIKVPVSVG